MMPLFSAKSQMDFRLIPSESNYEGQRGIIKKLFGEVDMAKRAGAYRSEKRKKEVKRQKKQEEKRLRRLGLVKPAEESDNPEAPDQEIQVSGETEEEQEAAQEEGQGEEKGEEQSA
jgi:hypothetical protein